MRFLDWAFRSRETGRITIGQAPNLAISLFATAWLATWLTSPASPSGLAARVAADVFLAYWAADELLRGVNPWRRVLGAGVLAYLAVKLLGIAGAWAAA